MRACAVWINTGNSLRLISEKGDRETENWKLRRGARETKRREELRQVKAKRNGDVMELKTNFFCSNSLEHFLSNWK
jgi:hypothetical protein